MTCAYRVAHSNSGASESNAVDLRTQEICTFDRRTGGPGTVDHEGIRLRGEWVQVHLAPQLRETGIVLRWYEGRHSFFNDGEIIAIGDEESGWMHDSRVEIMPVVGQ